jgi:hypothetical protein
MKKALQTTFTICLLAILTTITNAQTVVINEFMASNDTSAADADGEFDDWIELYNTSSSTVDMSGWYITDKADNITKYQFQNGLSLDADDYLIIWADEDSIQGDLHANFKLSANGELVILSDSMQNTIDSVSFGAQVTDVSYARFPNGTGNFILQAPTFNFENSPNSTFKIKKTFDFNIFPNPSSDFLNVEILETNSTDLFQIFDANGKIIHSENVVNANFQVDLSIFKNGLYLLKYGNSVRQFLVIK